MSNSIILPDCNAKTYKEVRFSLEDNTGVSGPPVVRDPSNDHANFGGTSKRSHPSKMPLPYSVSLDLEENVTLNGGLPRRESEATKLIDEVEIDRRDSMKPDEASTHSSFYGGDRYANLDDLKASASARAALVSVLSGLYALIVIVLAFAFEVSRVVSEESISFKYEPFYTYLYSVSLLFFAYCYFFLLRSTTAPAASSSSIVGCFGDCSSFFRSRKKLLLRNANQTRSPDDVAVVDYTPDHRGSEASSGAATPPAADPPDATSSASFKRRVAEFMSRKRKVTHSAPSAGSMYLRLGAVFFGIVGIVSSGIGIVSHMETTQPDCVHAFETLNCALSIAFTFVQLYFIFMNSKLTIHRFKNIGRIGTMHLVATNLCVWLRSVVAEEYHVIKEIGESIEQTIEKTQSMDQILGHASHDEHVVGHHTPQHGLGSFINQQAHLHNSSCAGHSEMDDYVKGIKVWNGYLSQILQPFMTTCVIEYSILCAAIIFILWRNIGFNPTQRVKHRKQSIRVDCSSSTRGLFLGLLFVVLTIIATIMFFTKVEIEANAHAIWIFYTADSVLYMVATVACCVGMYRMRNLKYVSSTKENMALLDDILLLLSLSGQLIYCLFSLTAIQISAHTISYMSMVVNLLRVVQVVLQTIFILGAQRLLAVAPEHQASKPGRETITFLLMVNISLWLINTLATQKASSNPLMVDFYGKGPWTMIVHSTVPLCIFFRFHSSVCLAEVWKNTYRLKFS